MRPILIRNARLIDPSIGTDIQGDLLIVDREVAAIGPGLTAPADCEVVQANGRVLVPGLIDASIFRTDVKAAVAGGVTTAMLMPDQSPPLDDPALVERAERLGKPRLWVRPLAAATRGLRGKELAELALMRDAGAVAVATGRSAIPDAQVMLRLLRYASGLGMVVITHAECPFLTHGAVATEGETATRLGLPAAPAAAEALQVLRDLRLAKEASAPIHFACLSTAEAIALVRAAKAAGQDVSAGTAPEYALLSDQALTGYRSYARLSPPLRSENDRLAVREGLADGTITILTSRHDPRTQEEKRQPFTDAEPGAAGLATLLAVSMAMVHDGLLRLDQLMALLSSNAAKRFGLPGGSLMVGTPADLLLFDPGAPWRIDSDELPGVAGNTPFDGLPVQGKILMLLKGGERLA